MGFIDAGVIHHNIEPPQVTDYRLNQGSGSLCMHQIGVDERMRPPSEPSAGLLRRLAMPMVMDGHLCPTPGELWRDNPTNPTRGTSDLDHTVGKVHGLPSWKHLECSPLNLDAELQTWSRALLRVGSSPYWAVQ
jgi:hypothetical protein